MKTVLKMQGKVDVQLTSVCGGCLYLLSFPGKPVETCSPILTGCIVSDTGVSNIHNIFDILQLMNGKDVEIEIKQIS